MTALDARARFRIILGSYTLTYSISQLVLGVGQGQLLASSLGRRGQKDSSFGVQAGVLLVSVMTFC